ncbi:hypothetical protein Tco_0774014 [Tanacetum coccineum]|uniref:Uncharacterized protein n=1 Tax=Tanacetum coccineum TaxID=301880 RepID=A0ABQ4ZMA7_9ASTR
MFFMSSSTPVDTLSEYEMKQKLYDMMQKSCSILAHDKHLELYNALMNLMGVDGSATKGDLDCTPSQHKRSHDDQDPPKDREGEKKSKRRRKDVGGSSSKKGKAQEDSPHYETAEDTEEPRQVDVQAHELVVVEDEPEEHELIIDSVLLFGKCMKKFLNKDKITKEDLEGPAFELIKKRFKNSVELEYGIEQCHLALTDKIDWANTEGNKFHNDLSKPLPLTVPPGRKKIPISYFFNNDLEYLKYRNKKKMYVLSVTKIKAARYEDEGIEKMITYLWSPSIQKYNRDAKLGIHY